MLCMPDELECGSKIACRRINLLYSKGIMENQVYLTDVDTPLGCMGVVFTEQALLRIHLPLESREATLTELSFLHPTAQPARPFPRIQSYLDELTRYFQGKPHDFFKVPLVLSALPAFHQRVLLAARNIPFGTTISYGELAREAGSPLASRAVGQALGKNPYPILIPCHRVFASGGKIGGFSAYGGIDTKKKLLALEGINL